MVYEIDSKFLIFSLIPGTFIHMYFSTVWNSVYFNYCQMSVINYKGR